VRAQQNQLHHLILALAEPVALSSCTNQSLCSDNPLGGPGAQVLNWTNQSCNPVTPLSSTFITNTNIQQLDISNFVKSVTVITILGYTSNCYIDVFINLIFVSSYLVISCSIIIVPAKYVFHHQKSYLTIKIYIAGATSNYFSSKCNTTINSINY
jgi:hypothetical protein